MKLTPVRIAAILIVVALLLLHPITRQVIFFILPLGSGQDDYVALALLVGGLVILFIKGWTRIPDLFRDKETK